MAFAILSDDTKSKLEQERSRLMEERGSIIQAAVAQATAEVDQMLQHLNQLLGYGTDASAEDKSPIAVGNPKSEQRSKRASRPASKTGATIQKASKKEEAASASQQQPLESVPKAEAKSTSKATAAASQSTSTKTLTLKPEFQSVTPSEAVRQILQQADQPMATEDVIPALYQSVEASDLSTARKSVALILGRGTHQGIYEKVEENPSRYQFKE